MDNIARKALDYLASRTDLRNAAVITVLQVEAGVGLVDINLADRGEDAGSERFIAWIDDDGSDPAPTVEEALADLKWVQYR